MLAPTGAGTVHLNEPTLFHYFGTLGEGQFKSNVKTTFFQSKT